MPAKRARNATAAAAAAAPTQPAKAARTETAPTVAAAAEKAVVAKAAPAKAAAKGKKAAAIAKAAAPAIELAAVADPVAEAAVEAAAAAAVSSIPTTVANTSRGEDPIGTLDLKGLKGAKVDNAFFSRVVVFASRGITSNERHFMNDLRALLPHHKAEGKLDTKKRLDQLLPEVMDLKSANAALFIEARKRGDHVYLWASRRDGPSCKFQLHDLHTMQELRLTGNCIKGSRPLLHFDENFATVPHLQVLQKLFVVMFGTPRGTPKSRPFVDHVMSFFYLDGRVYFRHYQVVETAAAKAAPRGAEAIAAKLPEASLKKLDHTLVEIGPRFALTPIKIFAGCAGGPVLWGNDTFKTPTATRVAAKKERADLATSRRSARSVALGRLEVPGADDDADIMRRAVEEDRSDADDSGSDDE